MSKITPFAGLYGNAPELIIHGRLQNVATAQKLAALAKQKGFKVLTGQGGFRRDVRLNEGFDVNAPVRDHTLMSALRYIENHPGSG
jgi:tRNA(Phe) wybutosine-synthesizing methylase Tyw3